MEVLNRVPTPAMRLPANFSANGPDTTWLTTSDGVRHIWFVHLGGKRWLVASLSLDNRSRAGFMVTTRSATEREMAALIVTAYGGWQVRQCNIKGVTSEVDAVQTTELRGPTEDVGYPSSDLDDMDDEQLTEMLERAGIPA